MIKNILIAGATGLLGKKLIAKLLDKGYNLHVLSRRATKLKNVNVFIWDVKNAVIDLKAFENIDAVINLAGESIATKRWSSKRKQELIDSRVNSTALLYKGIKESKAEVKKYISASAVGYYGDCGDTLLLETHTAGNDFLAKCCVAWEKAADEGKLLQIDVIKVRIGIVLSNSGGALVAMKTPINYFCGTALGTGKQWLPWIHIDDLTAIFLKTVADDKLNGVYNACAPIPATNATFTKTLASVLNRPIWPINAPKLLLKIAMGERANLVLMSTKTSADKILSTGFKFKHTDLKETLYSILKQK